MSAPQPFEDAAATLSWWMQHGENLWLLVRERGSLVPIAVHGRLKRNDERYYAFTPEDGHGTHYYIDVERARNGGRIIDGRIVDLGAEDATEAVFQLVAGLPNFPPTFPR